MIALLFSGRFQSICLYQTINHFFQLEKSRSEKFYYFLSLNEDVTNKYFVNQFCKTFKIDDECVSITKSELPPLELLKYKRQEVNFNGLWSMYTHNKKAFQMMKDYENKNDLSFDIVIKYRGDIISKNPMPLPCSTLARNLLEENTVYIPNDHDWGGVNDQIAIGTKESMEIYCNCIDNIPNLCYSGKSDYHPETLLLNHLKESKLNVSRFDFEYSLYRNK